MVNAYTAGDDGGIFYVWGRILKNFVGLVYTFDQTVKYQSVFFVDGEDKYPG